MNIYIIYSYNLKLENYNVKNRSGAPPECDFQQDLSSFIIHDDLNEINPNRYNI